VGILWTQWMFSELGLIISKSVQRCIDIVRRKHDLRKREKKSENRYFLTFQIPLTVFETFKNIDFQRS